MARATSRAGECPPSRRSPAKTHPHANPHAHAHAYIRTRIHTHKLTHTHTFLLPFPFPFCPCSFDAALQLKDGKGIGYTQTLGIEYQYLKPTINTPIYIDAKDPSTWPSLRGWFQCWINPNDPVCSPPDYAISPLVLNLPLQILQFLPGLAFFGK